jgi:hypothetical protein
VLALLAGLGYIGVHIAKDLDNVVVTSAWPYLLLGLALFIALDSNSSTDFTTPPMPWPR